MVTLHLTIKNFNQLLTKEEIAKKYKEADFSSTLCFLLRKENKNERK